MIRRRNVILLVAEIKLTRVLSELQSPDRKKCPFI